MGDIAPGEIKQTHSGELFVEIQDLCLSDDGCFFTTVYGSRIPVRMITHQALSTTLAMGAITILPLRGAFIKAVAE